MVAVITAQCGRAHVDKSMLPELARYPLMRQHRFRAASSDAQ